MSLKFNKIEVLEYIKNNKALLNTFFIKGDFNIFNDEHLKVIHAVSL